jgi:hypothetical protein
MGFQAGGVNDFNKHIVILHQLEPLLHEGAIIYWMERKALGSAQVAVPIGHDGGSDEQAPHFLDKWRRGLVLRVERPGECIQRTPRINRRAERGYRIDDKRGGRFHQRGVEFARDERGATEVDFPRSIDDAGHPAARVRGEEGPEFPRTLLRRVEGRSPYNRYLLYVLSAVERAGVLTHCVGERNVALGYEPSLLLVALVKRDRVAAWLPANYPRRPVAKLKFHGHLDRQEQDEFAREVFNLLTEVFLQTFGVHLSAQNGRRPGAELRQVFVLLCFVLEGYDLGHTETGRHLFRRQLQFLRDRSLTGFRVKPYGHRSAEQVDRAAEREE